LNETQAKPVFADAWQGGVQPPLPAVVKSFNESARHPEPAAASAQGIGS